VVRARAVVRPAMPPPRMAMCSGVVILLGVCVEALGVLRWSGWLAGSEAERVDEWDIQQLLLHTAVTAIYQIPPPPSPLHTSTAPHRTAGP
jgi:hypothetical protein